MRLKLEYIATKRNLKKKITLSMEWDWHAGPSSLLTQALQDMRSELHHVGIFFFSLFNSIWEASQLVHEIN